MTYILIVEDEPSVVRFLSRGLQEEGYTVDVCMDGFDAIGQAVQQHYDALIIDWMLPGLDGLALARQLRQRNILTPILMLTAKDETNSIVLALDAGVDDYMSKPFSFEELLARLRALLRRSQSAILPHSVKLGHVTFDVKKRSLVHPDMTQELSNREFALLELLVQHRGEILSRSRILDRVWGLNHDPSTNVVDVYIRYLRAKLDSPHSTVANSMIETVRKRGYRLIES